MECKITPSPDHPPSRERRKASTIIEHEKFFFGADYRMHEYSPEWAIYHVMPLRASGSIFSRFPLMDSA